MTTQPALSEHWNVVQTVMRTPSDQMSTEAIDGPTWKAALANVLRHSDSDPTMRPIAEWSTNELEAVIAFDLAVTRANAGMLTIPFAHVEHAYISMATSALGFEALSRVAADNWQGTPPNQTTQLAMRAALSPAEFNERADPSRVEYNKSAAKLAAELAGLRADAGSVIIRSSHRLVTRPYQPGRGVGEAQEGPSLDRIIYSNRMSDYASPVGVALCSLASRAQLVRWHSEGLFHNGLTSWAFSGDPLLMALADDPEFVSTLDASDRDRLGSTVNEILVSPKGLDFLGRHEWSSRFKAGLVTAVTSLGISSARLSALTAPPAGGAFAAPGM